MILRFSPGNAPTFHIPNIAFPVAEYYLEDVLNMTRYAGIRFQLRHTHALGRNVWRGDQIPPFAPLPRKKAILFIVLHIESKDILPEWC